MSKANQVKKELSGPRARLCSWLRSECKVEINSDLIGEVCRDFTSKVGAKRLEKYIKGLGVDNSQLRLAIDNTIAALESEDK